MKLGRIFDFGMAIVVVAGVWVAVSSPQTAGVVNAFSSAFTGGLKAATGR